MTRGLPFLASSLVLALLTLSGPQQCLTKVGACGGAPGCCSVVYLAPRRKLCRRHFGGGTAAACSQLATASSCVLPFYYLSKNSIWCRAG